MLGLVLMSLAATGPEAPPQYELTWRAPQQCPDEARVRAAVDGLLGDLDPTEAASFEGTVRRDGERWILSLRVGAQGQTGERQLEASSCDHLLDAAALIIAIAINPSVALKSAEPEPKPEAAAQPEPAPAPNPQPRPGPQSSLGFAATLGAGIGVGALPGPTPTLRLSAGLVGRWFRVDAVAGYWFARTETSTDNPAIEARLQLWTVGVRGCGVPARDNVEVPLCAQLEGGLMHGRASGAIDGRRGQSPWVAVRPSAAVVWRFVPWLGAVVGVELVVPVVRPRFATEPSGELYRAGPVAFEGGFGLEFRVARGGNLRRRP